MRPSLRARFDDMSMAPIPAGVDPGLLEPAGPERPQNRPIAPARSLQGCRVRNRAGEDLGTVEEIMIDLPTGRIAYAVLSFGGFLGIGNKLFAVPWQALSLQPDQEFVMDVEKKLLEKAPGFDRESYPNMADPEFIARIYSYYGYQHYVDDEDE